MSISSLRLQQFRSYDDEQFSLSPAVNVIVGPNGSGKTNLLEALYVISRGKSFRVADIELLQYNAEWARLMVEVAGVERILTFKKQAEKTEKRLTVDGVVKKRLTSRQRLNTVLFEPRDMELLTGSPERRRNYLDAIIEQTEIGYATTLSRYRRALAQRNALLKQSAVTRDHLFVWNVRLSELGAEIIEHRRKVVGQVGSVASDLYNDITSQTARVEVLYDCKYADVSRSELPSRLLRSFEQDYVVDRERGFTRSGPHRDDLSLLLNGTAASISASRGETRSLVVMMKLVEASLLANETEKPLMLLDDVFGELDNTRRQALAHYLTSYQTVITTTDADMVQSSTSRDVDIKTIALG